MKHILLIITLMLPTLANAGIFSCTGLLKMERRMLNDMPIKVDDNIDLVGFRVNCATHTVTFTRAMNNNNIQLKEGAQDRHTFNHCDLQGLAFNGWSVKDYLYDYDMELITTLNTSPDMCDRYR